EPDAEREEAEQPPGASHSPPTDPPQSPLDPLLGPPREQDRRRAQHRRAAGRLGRLDDRHPRELPRRDVAGDRQRETEERARERAARRIVPRASATASCKAYHLLRVGSSVR